MPQYQTKFDRTSLKSMYISYIRPILEYTPSLICHLTISEIERLEEAQRNAIRCITGAKVDTSHAPLNNELQLDSLSKRRLATRTVKFWEISNRHTAGRMNRNDLITSPIKKARVQPADVDAPLRQQSIISWNVNFTASSATS